MDNFLDHFKSYDVEKEDILKCTVDEIESSYRNLAPLIGQDAAGISYLMPKHWFISSADALAYVFSSDYVLRFQDYYSRYLKFRVKGLKHLVNLFPDVKSFYDTLLAPTINQLAPHEIVNTIFNPQEINIDDLDVAHTDYGEIINVDMNKIEELGDREDEDYEDEAAEDYGANLSDEELQSDNVEDEVQCFIVEYFIKTMMLSRFVDWLSDYCKDPEVFANICSGTYEEASKNFGQESNNKFIGMGTNTNKAKIFMSLRVNDDEFVLIESPEIFKQMVEESMTDESDETQQAIKENILNPVVLCKKNEEYREIEDQFRHINMCSVGISYVNDITWSLVLNDCKSGDIIEEVTQLFNN